MHILCYSYQCGFNSHQPTNPPTHQPTNPPTHQPTNPPTHQPTNHDWAAQ
ncbi:TPA: PT domain-containing protein [Escherichia coli]|nr:PT domain-containing protein [Escherichia coli]